MSGVTVIDWLKSLMLEQYDKNFLYGGYDMVDQCIEMTEQDLIRLKITPPGHIKRILANLKILKQLQNKSNSSLNNDSSCDVYQNFKDVLPGQTCANHDISTQSADNSFSISKNKKLSLSGEADMFKSQTLTKDISHKTPIPTPRKSSVSLTSDAFDSPNLNKNNKSIVSNTFFPVEENDFLNDNIESTENFLNNLVAGTNMNNIHTNNSNKLDIYEKVSCPHHEYDPVNLDSDSKNLKQNVINLIVLQKPVPPPKKPLKEKQECVLPNNLNISNQTNVCINNDNDIKRIKLKGICLDESLTESFTSPNDQQTELILSDLDLSYLENITNFHAVSHDKKNLRNTEKFFANLLSNNDSFLDSENDLANTSSSSGDKDSIYSFLPPPYPPPPLVLPPSRNLLDSYDNDEDETYKISNFGDSAPALPPRPDFKKIEASLLESSINSSNVSNDRIDSFNLSSSSVFSPSKSFVSSIPALSPTIQSSLSSPAALTCPGSSSSAPTKVMPSPAVKPLTANNPPIIPDKSLKPNIYLLEAQLTSAAEAIVPISKGRDKMEVATSQMPTFPSASTLTYSKTPTTTTTTTNMFITPPPISLPRNKILNSSVSTPDIYSSPSLLLSPSTSSIFTYKDALIETKQPLPSTRKLSKKCQAKLDLKLEGMLMKYENNLKSNVKRFFLLGEDSLCFCNVDKKSSMENIPLRRITSITASSNGLPKNGFEVFFKPLGQTMVLATETTDEKDQWTLNIARSIACVPRDDLHSINNFRKAGNVFIKIQPHSDDWQLIWMHISGLSLYYYAQEGHFEQFDLRKVKNIKHIPERKANKLEVEEGNPLLIELYGAKLKLQSYTKQETSSWFQSFNDLFKEMDITCLDKQFINGDNVPLAVDKCILYIFAFGMEVEGLYRLSGQNSKVSKLLELLCEDARYVTINQLDFQVHEVTNCLKRYLRQLQEPLFTSRFYPAWVNTLSIKDKEKRLMLYREVLNSLPLINYATIKSIIRHLSEVTKLSEVNKMDSINMASIFGPILLFDDKPDQPDNLYQSTSLGINIVKDFIENHTVLFDIKAEEKEEDEKVKEALKKMFHLNKKVVTNSSDDDVLYSAGMLISVVIGDVEQGETLAFNVTLKTRVNDLKEKLCMKYHSIVDDDKWALFEVVCSGELERMMQGEELLMDVLLKYRNWPVEFSRGSMIQYKQTDLVNNLHKFFDPQTTLYSELRYTNKKLFKKFYFEFTKCCLSYRKNVKSNSIISSWMVEDISIFFGVQKKRSPPTSYGFSFLQNNCPLVDGFFGHSICFGSDVEMYKWLATLLHAQNPGIFGRANRKSRSLSDLTSCAINGSAESKASLHQTTTLSPQNKSFKGSLKKKSMKASSSTTTTTTTSSGSSCSSSSALTSPTSVFYVQQHEERNPLHLSSSSLSSPPSSSSLSTPPITTISNSQDANKVSAVSKLFAKLTKS